MTRLSYEDYIISQEWRDKHKQFLAKAHYHCTMFPWVQIAEKPSIFPRIKVGKRRASKNYRYNCHHMNYRNLGDERMWRDVIVLCPLAHNVIIHGILSGFKRPSQQREYPNLLQRTAHFWCCTPVTIRLAFVVLMAINLAKLAL